MNEPRTARALYRKLLALYPRGFRDQLGESMEQTFHDLCNEQKQQPGYRFFLLAIFVETAIGVVREYLLIVVQGDIMKNILASPTSAAVTSFILALPIGLLRFILGSDIDALVAPLESMLTVDGSQPNALGYTMIYGGLLLLPVAFVLNLRPLLKREGLDRKRRFYAINLIVGVILSLLIVFTWGALIEEMYRCDVLQIPNCD